jgi:predicted RNA-binding protein
MCELSVYAWKGGSKELVMESVVRLIPKDGKVLMEGIFGESREVAGTLGEVDIISQTANVIQD